MQLFNALNLSGSDFLWTVLAIYALVISRYCAKLRQRQRQVEADYLNLLNTANAGIWIIDAEGRTTDVNQRLAGMLGYTTQQMQGRPIFDFLVNARVNPQDYFEDTQRSINEQSISFRRQDGCVFSGIVSTSPRLDHRGTCIGTLIMIAAHLQTQEALQQAQDERQSLLAQLEQQVQIMDTILSASPDH